VKWKREFDGGRYTSEDGRIVITLKNSGGKFAYMRTYDVKVDGKPIGSARLLKDAKAAGMRWASQERRLPE
jgi:hypothetical protein